MTAAINVSHQSSEDIRGKSWFHLRQQNAKSGQCCSLSGDIQSNCYFFKINYLRAEL